jgi:4-methyl-5(b-hydroxyethyl)-thiazole monophosphate biosynthesis
LVPLAQGCEELEAITIVDLLRRAGIEVITAGLDDRPVRASRGTVLIPDTTLDEVQERGFDMVVLPGGLPGADHLNEDRRVHRLITEMAAGGKPVAAICAAPKVLARAGLLKGKTATSFPGAIPESDLAGVHYVESPVVEDGNILTSRGPGTAMDFALALIERLAGRAKREEVEKPLQRPAA